MSTPNSGFLKAEEGECEYSASFADIEVICLRKYHFLALATRYGRRWLLKGLKKEFACFTRPGLQLQKEFEILSSLSHPGIVGCIGFEHVGDLGRCIVMEYVEGDTLEKVLEEDILSGPEKRRLMEEILEASAYLHSKGIIHRDLNPSNIMVRRNGRKAVIIDFGLADSDSHTLLKAPAGTEGYISDHQQQSHMPRPADDVFSLGVIMRRLCPEWARIAIKCTGKAQKRYTDASYILRALRGRTLLRKRLSVASACIAIAAVAASLLLSNMRLRSSLHDLRQELAMTRRAPIPVNDISAEAALADSLRTVRQRLAEESAFRKGILEREARISRIKESIRTELDKAYRNFLATDSCPSYGDPQTSLRLLDALRKAKDSVLARTPSLSDKDNHEIEVAFYNHQHKILQHWSNSPDQNN